MGNLRLLAALGLVGMAGAAHAADVTDTPVTANVTIVNDYDFRGVTQTDNGPAIQAGLDWAHDSGWYVGTWGSSVDFGPDSRTHAELNLYTGFAGKSAAGLGWDAGVLQYIYPDESDLNFLELYGKLSYGLFGTALHYSNDYAGTDESAFYATGSMSIPLVAPLTLDLHIGYSDGDGILVAFGEDSYMDYSVGFTYSASNFDVGMKWVGTDLEDDGSRVILSLSTALPW